MRGIWRGLLLAFGTFAPLSALAVACSDEADPATPADGGFEAAKIETGPEILVSDVVVDTFVPPPIDGGKAFDFAPPYVAALGPSSRSDAGHNVATNTPRSNPAKTRCLDCHKAGGTARPFFAAGTIETSSGGGDASMIEVRLKAYISANAVTVYTDVDGNWFVPAEQAVDAGVNFALRPGIRRGGTQRMMGSSPAIGNCNQCHGGAPKL